MHHKFVVVDFKGKDPVVYCGTSNLAFGPEQKNDDNLLRYVTGILLLRLPLKRFAWWNIFTGEMLLKHRMNYCWMIFQWQKIYGIKNITIPKTCGV